MLFFLDKWGAAVINGRKWGKVVHGGFKGVIVAVRKKFRSRSEHALDAKGRLNFPSRYRDVLRHFDSELLMVTAWGRHLRAYPVSEWELIENKIWGDGKEQTGLGPFARLIISSVTECSLDKQGRILLPPPLRSEAGLKKEVVLTGMLDWVEIWDKEAWIAEQQATKANFENYQEALSKLGIF